MRVDRIDQLEKYIIEKRSVTLDSLCETFDVSKNTLRRDIETLIKRGNIRKVYGGVVAVERTSSQGLRSFRERNSLNLEAKSLIAAKAASLISNGDTVFLDTGSSILPIVSELGKLTEVTVVTNSVPIIYKALEYPSINVIALPGTLNRSTDSLVGATCIESLSNFHLKKAVMACTGLTISEGACNASFAEYEIKREAVKISEERILLVDHTKFGVTSMMKYSPLEQFDYLVTDEEPSSEFMKAFEDMNIKLVM